MAISYNQGKPLLDLVGKSTPKDVRIALIENAADVYQEGEKDWMYENRDSIKAHGFQVELIDLEEHRLGERRDLTARLENADVIWLGGGNTYYLRWILRKTRADTIIRGYIKRGKVYGGGSAGAIVAGPTLNHFQLADEPSRIDEEILEGLNLTRRVVIPHWNNEKYGDIMRDAKEKLESDGFETLTITDDQAVILNGDEEPQVI